MDTFVEQIIKKKKGVKEFTVIAGLIIAFLLVSYLSLALGFLSLLIILGAGYGGWYLITSLNLEYEYSVTNGDIDIDQIIAQRKRKRVVSVIGSKIESLEPYKADIASRHFDRRVIAAPSEVEPDLWCFTYHSKKSGHTLVIFQPEQRVLDALKVGLPALVLRETNKKQQSIE